ncbi:putative argininosuccinate lyase [Armadillidium nasatum]|uniref:Putative argininosuccinate lyase n=1 Tax=Armadillidium nasatum TaxID=96803 RepID=A0A5N5T7C0_9CRUS|nr:putative argininosuccinate lyase [Armadillidium nasatum]
MWLKDHLLILEQILKETLQVFLCIAEKNLKILFPGYTHLQRAQTVRFSHWLLSYSWFLFNDLQKLKFLFVSVDVCPLGSGALAGNPFKVDRMELAQNLSFSKVSENSMMAVSDRDFVAEYLFWCSLTSVHLSRLAEDLIIYSSSEFGFVKLADEFSTGSSLMPQKKNPDGLELIRGKAGRMIGNLTGFLAIMKGLPSTYNKDLQDDKEVLFNSAETILMTLQVIAGTVQTLKVQPDACSKALTEDMLATDLAYFLVRKGLPFREAHEKVGEVVKKAEKEGCTLSQLSIDHFQNISPLFTEEVSRMFDFENSVEQYASYGGTSSGSVINQIKRMREALKKFSLKN